MSELNVGTISTSEGVRLPVTNPANRPTGPQKGFLIFNSDINNIEFYSGNAWTTFGKNKPPVATGGSESTSGGFRIHTFTGSNSFDVTSGGIIEFLIVAGGGGGGVHHGGGGGGGGVITGMINVADNTSYAIQIGQGGAGAPAGSSAPNGTSGGPSSAFGYTAIGGGYGGSYPKDGAAGGSGGGPTNWSVSKFAGEGTWNQGNWGAFNNGATNVGGGGGGAGAVGGYTRANAFRDGGIGLLSPISGSPTYYGGGGGAGSYPGYGSHGPAGVGGPGGGGIGGQGPHNAGSVPGTGGQNTGGGGGGVADLYKTGGPGGSGIVIIRYIAS